MKFSEVCRMLDTWSNCVNAMDSAYHEMVCQIHDDMIQWDDYERLPPDQVSYLVSAIEVRHRIEQAAGITTSPDVLPQEVYDDLGTAYGRGAFSRFEDLYMDGEELLVKDMITGHAPSHAATAVLLRAFLRALGEALSISLPADTPSDMIYNFPERISEANLVRCQDRFWASTLYGRSTVRDVFLALFSGSTHFTDVLATTVLPIEVKEITPGLGQATGSSLAVHIFAYMGLPLIEIAGGSKPDRSDLFWALDRDRFERFRGYVAARYAAGILEINTDDMIVGTLDERDLPFDSKL